MSFTADVKKELTGINPERKCCELAEITGFLRLAGSITFGFGGMGIKVSTDNPAVARHFVTLMKNYFTAKSALTIAENPGPARSKLYELTITPDMNAEAILRETGMLGIKEGSNYLTDGIDPSVVRKRCCKKAALRGLFLAAGSINDPAKGYHMEINCSREDTAASIRKLVNGFGLNTKVTERRGKYVVYLKDAEQIGDFLNIIGATGQFLKFQDVRLTKELKNNANRAFNCDMANSDRAMGAAQKQIEAIRYIEQNRGLDSLPDRLYETARKRLDYPELSLTELAEMFDPPIKKSGLNHRFEKIITIAENMKNGC